MKTRRHAKILELIKEYDIDTQDELLRYLRENGFDVTQATVSRDIKELRLVKTLSRSGKYRYSTGSDTISDMSSKFYSLFSDSVLSVEAAQNMLVVRCMTGMAQAVCASLDSMHWPGFVGTLAGDDTIFIVCRTEGDALETQEEFRKLINRLGFMLAQLFINNIAVIERASIDLEKGFTVLTGETGAGKSIIIDAIHAVLGERTSKELVRTGTQSASVSALFTGLDEDILRLLDQLSIPREEDGSLLVQRDIRQEGRSSCKLNGAPATVSMLKQVGPRLVTIHGQHESYELL